MFTGIVDHCGKIEAVTEAPGGLRFKIRSDFTQLALGESISVDGTCLTVVSPEPGILTFELSPETLNLTAARTYRPGRWVNLERALQLGDRMGGHWVTGHIDGTALLREHSREGDYIAMTFGDFPAEGQRFLIKKGSVAINGVSLTVNDVGPDYFKVMLIPHTLERTNLKDLSVGSEVNIEWDWMMKVIVNETLRINRELKEKPL